MIKFTLKLFPGLLGETREMERWGWIEFISDICNEFITPLPLKAWCIKILNVIYNIYNSFDYFMGRGEGVQQKQI